MLVDAVRSCGVSFKVWRAKDENGYTSKSGKYDWTALSGSELKKVQKDLPPKFFTFLPPDISETVVKIWNDFSVIYYMLALPDSKEVDVLQEKAKDWVCFFLSLQDQCEGHQKKSITPYIHALVYHVSEMIRRLGSIKPFSGQGVEKNNDDAKKNYYSSNRHDPCGDILVTRVE